MTDLPIYIAGKKVVDGERFSILNPYTGEAIASAIKGDKSHIDRAAEDAKLNAPAFKRADWLRAASALIGYHSEELARILSSEVGKTIREARIEVDRAARIFALAIGETERLSGEQAPFGAQPNGQHRFGFFVRRPVGIVGAITPFNVPLALAAHKIAPALGAGNAVILKPAEQAPWAAVRLIETLYDAGFPPESLSVITGFGPEAGLPLIQHERVGFVSFTGSREVGRQIPGWAGAKRVTLELGGNCPLIVAPSADVGAAAEAACRGGFAQAGQLCISVQRAIVHESHYQKFVVSLSHKAESLKLGDPLDESTDMGPMIDSEALDRVGAWIADQVGAKIMTGGEAAPPFYRPTVLTDVPRDAKMSCSELFGPAVIAYPYQTADEAIELANGTPYGLQAGVFTQDLNEAFDFANRLEFGGVMINEAPTFRSDLMPYGGTKESGLGREGVRFAMQEMTETKVIGFKNVEL